MSIQELLPERDTLVVAMKLKCVCNCPTELCRNAYIAILLIYTIRH